MCAGNPQGADVQVLKTLQHEVSELLETEEIMWRQWSRNTWLTKGDRNTKFFHHQPCARKAKNVIKGIEDDDGVWLTEGNEVEKMFLDYFKDIFKTSQPTGTDQILTNVQNMVSTEMNSWLSRDLCRE